MMTTTSLAIPLSVANEEGAIVECVNHLLHKAIQSHASDVHFEPYETTYRVRFRIDGLLTTFITLPAHMAPRIAARIKVLAHLDIAQKRLPQDGHFQISFAPSRPFDCRVSTCPTSHGEKIVVRILEAATLVKSLEQLGLEEEQKALFLHALQQPQGLLLMTGPTGSGKTISLYSALHFLNREEVNIATVEDPVEIAIPGINQVSIQPKAGLTFPVILRAFLRQDPDILMVGEIRDLETADIAIKAAQTGHLVLATLHTAQASEAMIRLTQMGIAPFHLASALTLIMSQRLVRTLCPECHPYPKKQDTLKECSHCRQGFRGRIGVYELLPLSPLLFEIFLEGGSPQAIRSYMQQQKLLSLKEAGLQKVRRGLTTLREVERVIGK